MILEAVETAGKVFMGGGSVEAERDGIAAPLPIATKLPLPTEVKSLDRPGSPRSQTFLFIVANRGCAPGGRGRGFLSTEIYLHPHWIQIAASPNNSIHISSSSSPACFEDGFRVHIWQWLIKKSIVYDHQNIMHFHIIFDLLLVYLLQTHGGGWWRSFWHHVLLRDLIFLFLLPNCYV